MFHTSYSITSYVQVYFCMSYIFSWAPLPSWKRNYEQRVYPQCTVLTVRDTMKTHFKVLLSIPRIFLNLSPSLNDWINHLNEDEFLSMDDYIYTSQHTAICTSNMLPKLRGHQFFFLRGRLRWLTAANKHWLLLNFRVCRCLKSAVNKGLISSPKGFCFEMTHPLLINWKRCPIIGGLEM